MKICPVCNQEFVPRKTKQRTCSFQCRDVWKTKTHTETRNCPRCGRSFTCEIASKKIFCSLKCIPHKKKRGPRKERVCEICQKPFEYAPHRNPHFCSNECRYAGKSIAMRGENSPRWRGGTSIRGHNWNAQSRAAQRRDGNKCVICGRKKHKNEKAVLGVHHIKPYRDFNGDWETANQLPNLITLCRKCHSRVEWHGKPCPQVLF